MHTVQFDYVDAGTQMPVFLCPDVDICRVYVDVPQGARVMLDYTYEPERVVRQAGAKVKWEAHEAGVLTADFAAVLYGPPTAVRLRVLRPSCDGAVGFCVVGVG